MNYKKKINASRGFTLIELLVVISIIGFLTTLGVVNLKNAREKSRDATRLSDLRSIKNALEMYYNDNRGYPLQAENAKIGEGSLTTLINGDLAPYLAKRPFDPLGPGNAEYFFYYDGNANCAGGEYARIAVVYAKKMERVAGNRASLCSGGMSNLDGGGDANSFYVLIGPSSN